MFKITLCKLRASAVSLLKLWCEIRRYRFVLFPEHLGLWTFSVPRYQPFGSTQHSNLFEVIVHVPKYNPEKVQSWWLSFEQKCLFNQKKRNQIRSSCHLTNIAKVLYRGYCIEIYLWSPQKLQLGLQCIKFVLPARGGTTAKVPP